MTDALSAELKPTFSVRNLSKTFGGSRALDSVAFSVAPGEVHGLLGKNGSGKSTLVKVLAGYHPPDLGAALELDGKPVPLPLKPGAFRRLGMSFVHQNLGLYPTLSVLENLRIATIIEAGRWRIDWRAERTAARAAIERFGLDLDLAAPVETLSPVDQALLAIVRAFEDIRHAREAEGAAGLLLLDEPTPFLPRAGVEKLFSLVRRITAEGSSVIFVSHDVDEVMEITDRVTVLRDGKVVGELTTATSSAEDVIEAIVGRRMARAGMSPKSAPATARPVLARLTGVAGGGVAPTDLEIGRGEVVGLTGLIGSGYEALPYLIFGARKAAGGTLSFADAPGMIHDLTRAKPRASLELGLALLPGDRAAQGAVDSLSIADNMTLPSLDRFFRNGMLDRRGMIVSAADWGERYAVRPNDPGLELRALSGGNAQKVLIARWMSRSPRLLLLDEPTQGVDVGAREQIFTALKTAADEGLGVVCASSDYEQLAEICDRVLIFNRGRVVAVLTGAEISKEALAAACYAAAGDDLSDHALADHAIMTETN